MKFNCSTKKQLKRDYSKEILAKMYGVLCALCIWQTCAYRVNVTCVKRKEKKYPTRSHQRSIVSTKFVLYPGEIIRRLLHGIVRARKRERERERKGSRSKSERAGRGKGSRGHPVTTHHTVLAQRAYPRDRTVAPTTRRTYLLGLHVRSVYGSYCTYLYTYVYICMCFSRCVIQDFGARTRLASPLLGRDIACSSPASYGPP